MSPKSAKIKQDEPNHPELLKTRVDTGATIDTTVQPDELKEKGPFVMVACPNGLAFRNEYSVNAMFMLGWHLAANGIRAISKTYDEHPLSIARNMTVADVLKAKEVTHLFFVDSDVVLPLDIVTRFIKHNQPIVSGWYLSRKSQNPVAGDFIENPTTKTYESIRAVPDQFPKTKSYTLPELLTKTKEKTGLIKVGYVGLGCMLIKREVLETLSHPNRPLFYEDRVTQHGFSEDLYFALICAQNQIPLQIDSAAFCPHFTFGLIDQRHVAAIMQRIMQEQQKMQQNIQKPPM